ncbi:uncharacterized protein EDB91DRAFT_1078472 [Suillus paluster]|uniref:uncharacterized protein n=1 Tax=Suillus paluster TaxID=48578 RepID=UPI001B886949|nr:uncharacterized protein EDB91DRAFT_1078472 [Suillus paluster]KAG1750436.1 hypothetical protein EDB91DRAFT_1078472 [Suillus paluster]
MPSFLNKVFGRKTGDDKDQPKLSQDSADLGLLDGKYEAVSPLTFPASNFATLSKAQTGKDHAGFSLFRPKSRIGSTPSSHRRNENLPQLSLQLPSLKDNTESLGVFEVDPESQRIFDDSVIGAKLLNPSEALILVRACAQTITERGLETLGIMHPHWHSASPDIQRKLISLFIHSLAPKSRITTLSPTPAAAISAFETELEYTRSPHDVAAVLRWGLRHLVLENNSFGKNVSAPEWAWYKSFFDAEKEASYPHKSFTELLLPQLPQAHIELLLATVDIISALASHAEANSISGSKLSKFLGLWLLTATRTEPTDNWTTFYARWERAGRILEHLFLSRIREESFNSRLPTRLQELVKHYPYSRGSRAAEEDLLPHPLFSTRTCSVLFVRVETLLSETATQPKASPVRLLVDAFNLSSEGETFEQVELWNALKTAATETASTSTATGGQEGPYFGRVFVDETIHLLASISRNSSSPLMSPALEVASPVPRRSSPFSKILERTKDQAAHGNGNGNGAMSPISSIASPIIHDWAQFSTSGFGETSATTPLAATLLDTDVEITEPVVSPKSSKKWGRSRSSQRSADSPQETSTKEPAAISTKLAGVHMAQVDEAFIDFWSDAIADPITENWPSFVICGLKPLHANEAVNWLIIEQTYVRQQSPRPRATSPERRGRTSPRPSFRSDISGTFAATRKRLSFFSGGSKSNLSGKKGIFGKSPKVGELGEMLPEEEERPETPKAMTSRRRGLGLGVAAAAVGAVAAETVRPPAPSQEPVVAAPTIPQPQQDNTVPGLQEEAIVEEAIPPARTFETSEPAALIVVPDESVLESEVTLVEGSVSQSEPAPAEEELPAGEPEVVPTAPEPTQDIEHIVETSASDNAPPAPELPIASEDQISIVEESPAEEPVDESVVENSTPEVEDTEVTTQEASAPVSEAEATQPEVSEEDLVDLTQAAEPADDQSKLTECTNGAASIEPSLSADAQD